jgi:hypothetical protein
MLCMTSSAAKTRIADDFASAVPADRGGAADDRRAGGAGVTEGREGRELQKGTKEVSGLRLLLLRHKLNLSVLPLSGLKL